MTSGSGGHIRSFPPEVSALIIRFRLYCIHFIKETLLRPTAFLHNMTIILDHSSVLRISSVSFSLPAAVHYPQRHQTAANAHSAVLIIRKKAEDHPHIREQSEERTRRATGIHVGVSRVTHQLPRSSAQNYLIIIHLTFKKEGGVRGPRDARAKLRRTVGRFDATNVLLSRTSSL